MAKEWIEDIAQDIKQKNHDAAQEFGRAQHYAGIISSLGKEFFMGVVFSLEENIDALRSRLQGDPASSETTLQTIKADEVKIVRARFPWVDARVIHRDDTITLDYAKGSGVDGDPSLDRKSRAFTFQVAPDDSLFVEDAFADSPGKYRLPEELARQITEILFSVNP